MGSTCSSEKSALEITDVSSKHMLQSSPIPPAAPIIGSNDRKRSCTIPSDQDESTMNSTLDSLLLSQMSINSLRPTKAEHCCSCCLSKTNLDTSVPMYREYGVFASKNSSFRKYMEDVYSIVQNFRSASTQDQRSYFGVYDGHGGDQVSKYIGRNLHVNLLNRIERRISLKSLIPQAQVIATTSPLGEKLNTNLHEEEQLTTSAIMSISDDNRILTEDEVHDCIYESYQEIDAKLAEENFEPCCGSTSVSCLVRRVHDKVVAHVANVGDSSAILCRNGIAQRITYSHHAKDQKEADRIRTAGGIVFKNRVAGILSVTRSFGHSEEKAFISCDPELASFEVSKDDAFLVLVTDGVTDALSDQKIVNFVSEQFEKGSSSSVACKRLVAEAKMNNSLDNLTAVIIRFH